MSHFSEDIVFSTVCFLLELKSAIDPESFEELQEILSLSEWGISPEIKNLIGEPSFIERYASLSQAAARDVAIPATLQQVAQCIELLEDLKDVLEDVEMFKCVLRALQFDNLAKTHSEVTRDLDAALASFPEAQRLSVRRVFTERAVIGELGNFRSSPILTLKRLQQLGAFGCPEDSAG